MSYVDILSYHSYHRCIFRYKSWVCSAVIINNIIEPLMPQTPSLIPASHCTAAGCFQLTFFTKHSACLPSLLFSEPELILTELSCVSTEVESEMAEETGPDAKIIKARGLPWSASADEVLAFFSECKVIGGTAGVHFGMNR